MEEVKEKTKYEKKYYDFLDGLRESGKVNMFGASVVLLQIWPELGEEKAKKVLVDWMKTFGEREEAKPGGGLSRSRGQIE